MSVKACFSFRARTLGIAAASLSLGLAQGCSPEAQPDDPIGVGGAMGGGGTTGGTGLTSGSGGTSAGKGGTGGTGGTSGSSLGGSAGTSTGGTGGASGSGGTAGQGQSGAGATSGAGGVGAGGGGMGGSSAAGVSGGGAGGSNGGMSGGGAGGATSGAGGTAGGSAGSGGKAAVNPSAGCGKMNPSLGSSGSPLMVSGHQYYMKVPGSYDGNKPFPVLFMFNPTNNPINWAEQNAGFEQNGAKDAWIRVYPHPANSSSGWGAGDVSFFQPLYDAVTNALCVDMARMFASGESSGGDFSSILGCEHANKLRGVGPCSTKPVGQYPLNANSRNCTGQVDAVIIHGKNDNVVGPENGPLTRDFYVALNHCSNMSTPVPGYTDTLSNCVEYQGCDPGYPVVWCQHTDPNYSGTNHGWPAFADNFLFERFSKY